MSFLGIALRRAGQIVLDPLGVKDSRKRVEQAKAEQHAEEAEAERRAKEAEVIRQQATEAMIRRGQVQRAVSEFKDASRRARRAEAEAKRRADEAEVNRQAVAEGTERGQTSVPLATEPLRQTLQAIGGDGRPVAKEPAARAKSNTHDSRESWLREKDVEALCFAGCHAMMFIKRHNLKGMHADLGGADFYCERVGRAFKEAAEQIVAPDKVAVIFRAAIYKHERERDWNDNEMCTVFLPLLDQAMLLIGHRAEVMPLAWLKTDLKQFAQKSKIPWVDTM